MTYMKYVTLPDPSGLLPALFLLYSSDPAGQMYNQCSKSRGAAWVPWCWAWEMSLWCHMSMGPTPPMKADGSIICPSTPAFLHPNIHLSIQTVTAPKSSQTPYKTSQRGKSRSYVCQKKINREVMWANAHSHKHTPFVRVCVCMNVCQTAGWPRKRNGM